MLVLVGRFGGVVQIGHGQTRGILKYTQILNQYHMFDIIICETQVNILEAKGRAQKQNLPSCLKKTFRAASILVPLAWNKYSMRQV